jgi:putative tricarboxylic transport membrane protein
VNERQLRFVTGLMIAFIPVSLGAQTSQWKPEKNVEIIVGRSAGGGIDTTARLLQRIWQTTNAVPTSVTVLNRPGAGGAIGWVYMNKFSGDGHYLSVSATNLVTNRITGAHGLSHTDVTALAMLFHEYVALVTHSDNASFKSGKELVAKLRAAPESINVGLASVGNVMHLGITQTARSAGGDPAKLKTVVFNSAGQSVTALLGGHIDIVPTAPANLLAHLKTGNLRVLAITAPARLPGILAQVPTLRELGMDVVVTNWRAVVGPKGMTASQVTFWDEVFAKTLRHDDWVQDNVRNLRDGSFMLSSDTALFFAEQEKQFRHALADIGLAR